MVPRLSYILFKDMRTKSILKFSRFSECIYYVLNIICLHLIIGEGSPCHSLVVSRAIGEIILTGKCSSTLFFRFFTNESNCLPHIMLVYFFPFSIFLRSHTSVYPSTYCHFGVSQICVQKSKCK